MLHSNQYGRRFSTSYSTIVCIRKWRIKRHLWAYPLIMVDWWNAIVPLNPHGLNVRGSVDPSSYGYLYILKSLSLRINAGWRPLLLLTNLYPTSSNNSFSSNPSKVMHLAPVYWHRTFPIHGNTPFIPKAAIVPRTTFKSPSTVEKGRFPYPQWIWICDEQILIPRSLQKMCRILVHDRGSNPSHTLSTHLTTFV
jgi:hypothetical protein